MLRLDSIYIFLILFSYPSYIMSNFCIFEYIRDTPRHKKGEICGKKLKISGVELCYEHRQLKKPSIRRGEKKADVAEEEGISKLPTVVEMLVNSFSKK